jgi:hypothetical protein
MKQMESNINYEGRCHDQCKDDVTGGVSQQEGFKEMEIV